MASKNWIIGADATCDVVVGQPTVSGRHCRLSQTPEGFLLQDLQSSNGTFVNGRRLREPLVVSPQDSITLGRSVPMPWPAEILGKRHANAKAAPKHAAAVTIDKARQARPAHGRQPEQAAQSASAGPATTTWSWTFPWCRTITPGSHSKRAGRGSKTSARPTAPRSAPRSTKFAASRWNRMRWSILVRLACRRRGCWPGLWPWGVNPTGP